ncbi:ATPase, T2SS/T4P/T4SS family [Clostridium sulfidigenes]|uniref:ATPase, T2SS/T4P/T4SS family n=1 Tax=Clostridium sulfidigenes TaxID=318464 RepID=UPI003F8AB02C
MPNIVLADELNKEESKKNTTKINIGSIDRITSKVVNYFVENKAVLINEVEDETLPFSAMEREIEYYISSNDVDLKGFTKEEIFKSVYDYLYKYYTFQDYLETPEVTTITAIAKDNIIITKIKNGVEQLFQAEDIYFDSDDSYDKFCNYIARRNEVELNNKNAIRITTDKERCKDAILRIDITGSAINESGLPCIVIRKTPRDKYSDIELVKKGMFNEEMRKYFEECVESGAQILTCGDGGSGKTTWMNAFIEKIDENIKALFVQESGELHSKKKNIIFQKIKKKSSETDTEYSLNDITRNAMLMSVKLIGIGEIKGPEAFDLFNASYSGHIAWSSVHAMSSTEAITKLLQYIQYASVNLKEEALLEMLSRLDIVIFLKDFKCLEVTEVEGYDYKNNKIIYNPVFRFDFRTNKFERIKPTCKRLQEKIDYHYYKKRRREIC